MTDLQKRRALLDECEKMKKAWEAKDAALANDDSLNDAEYEAQREAAYAEYIAAERPIWYEAFYLQFPNRRGWFADVFVPSFGRCENKRLSVKQTEVFRRYCVANEDTWQTGDTFCRAGEYKIRLCIPRYSHGIGFVTIM